MNVDRFIPEWAKEATPALPEDARSDAPAWRDALLAGLVAAVVVGSAVLLAHAELPTDVDDTDETTDDEMIADDVTADELDAADHLGISVDASADEVRAALRERIAASRIHPDQGGAHADAARLIAAKNLLCDRARRRSNTTNPESAK
ncbi:MAG: hypothetical protein JWM53_4515 [bacterium]|nr:hypothetical protein [bacterium]